MSSTEVWEIPATLLPASQSSRHELRCFRAPLPRRSKRYYGSCSCVHIRDSAPRRVNPVDENDIDRRSHKTLQQWKFFCKVLTLSIDDERGVPNDVDE